MVFTQHHAVAAFVDALARAGVTHACVAPGARSTPLTLCLAAHPHVRVWSHVDERSAAFFALGFAKRTRRPVALVCTSGTAAANFFPAIVEAAYARVPLVVVTADRPPELRDCGAPQTIDQVKLYGTLVKWFVEVGDPASGEPYFRSIATRAAAVSAAVPPGPVHLNVPLREPLTPPAEVLAALRRPAEAKESGSGEAQHGRDGGNCCHGPFAAAQDRLPTHEAVAAAARLLHERRRGLVLCGPRDTLPGEAAAILRCAEVLGYPVLADPSANVGGGANDGRVDAYDVVLRDARTVEPLRPDVVLRIGALPTSKALTLLLRDRWDCPHVVLDPLGTWDDPLRARGARVHADVAPTCLRLAEAMHRGGDEPDPAWRRLWMGAGARARASLAARFGAMNDLFEGKAVSVLAECLPGDACLYVGNSMPVRDVEAFWPLAGAPRRVLTNRGVNGIDGFVSSVLGAAAAGPDVPVIGLTGDLGFYHDLNGLLAARRAGVRATLIVFNNDGGGIFSYLPQAECGADFEELFLTPHGLDFRGAVEMYGCRFVRIASWDQFRSEVTASLTAPQTTVIEVPIDRIRSVALHRELFHEAGAAAREGMN
ncbi:2-succinyl-5-enolpyruvyl-6-hydroxy-3-cyclohexene-1-carboxylic-acid synthase [Candidatus Binatia bacterium]|nr:2-succinyl-5-enolpyruvyl-6-hydroxy-3-cyclohexene-1-carboxylic-acid synthase [Candidatus Binatia bacterium]